ncbi:MAG TPA: helix-turn-helix transcriptional regulator, partial [Syntrophales bacterium]|nr:helix-turn-helix transcriptional regulator [Syntrophales bacterium]HOT47602.1 helix-turn-helix transcriptional regulator [Syntrophales bacterium]HPK17273.1 helix-turn-helix transcriptional regulator [Syntrophales bacterium]HQF75499.1 helix-turn-helix transcriptional regulator [Syntrophales bacterium]
QGDEPARRRPDEREHAGGLHNRDIAAHLNTSGHTVRTHLYNIFRKIHVRSRVQASLWIHGHVERFFCVV